MSRDVNSKIGVQKRSGVSLKYPLWVWSYAWFSHLLDIMLLNMLVAVIPSMMSDLGIAITVMGALLGLRRLMRFPASWLAGYFGDKWGRIAWLRLSSLIFIASTILVASTWDFWSFVVFTFFAEFAWGTGGSLQFVIVAEHSPAEHRGWLVGITNAFAFGATFGSLLASLTIGLGLGWRFAFLILTIPAAINLVQSLFVKESERFLELKKVKQAINRGDKMSETDLKYAIDLEKTKHSGLRQLFGKDIRKVVIIYAIFWGLSTIFWSNGSSYWTIFLPAEKGLTYIESLTVFGLLWAISEPGFFIGSFLGQIIGRNQTMKVGFALATIGSFTMVQFAYGFNQILLFSVVMMLGAGLVYGSDPGYAAEVFPTRIRSMIYAWSSTVSSIMQLIVFNLMPYFAKIFGWSLTYQLFITTSAFLCFALLFTLPKPNPKAELEEISK